MKFRVFPVVLVLALVTLAGMAQTQPQPPPKVVRIYREEVKPGMGAAHAKIEAGWPKAFAKAGTANYYVALTSFSGGNEALFLEPQTSYSAIEKMDADVEKNAVLGAELDKLAEEDHNVLNNTRTMIAAFNENLSRPSGEPFPNMRYIMVTTYRVRPGHNAEFTEFRTLLKSLQEETKAPNRYLVYNVTSGAPAGTFLLLRALKSLSELDPQPNAQPFSPESQRKLNELVAACLISSETAIYNIKPEMSHAPKEFAAANPAFWGAKPKPPSKSAVKKEAKAATTN